VYVRRAGEPNPPYVAFAASPNAARVTVRVEVEVAVLFATWTTAAEPFVPPVSTPTNWLIEYQQYT
jgi:hypothetical protein